MQLLPLEDCHNRSSTQLPTYGFPRFGRTGEDFKASTEAGSGMKIYINISAFSTKIKWAYEKAEKEKKE